MSDAEALRYFFDRNQSFNNKHFAALAGVSRQRASKILRRLLEMKVLDRDGARYRQSTKTAVRDLQSYSVWDDFAARLPDFAYVRLLICGTRQLKRSQALSLLDSLPPATRVCIVDFESIEEVSEIFLETLLHGSFSVRSVPINHVHLKSVFDRLEYSRMRG